MTREASRGVVGWGWSSIFAGRAPATPWPQKGYIKKMNRWKFRRTTRPIHHTGCVFYSENVLCPRWVMRRSDLAKVQIFELVLNLCCRTNAALWLMLFYPTICCVFVFPQKRRGRRGCCADGRVTHSCGISTKHKRERKSSWQHHLSSVFEACVKVFS